MYICCFKPIVIAFVMILFSSSKDDDDDGDLGYQLSHGWLKNIVRDPTAVETTFVQVV